MEKAQFAIVGAGWRSEFFLRIARELPERFQVSGVVARKADKAEAVRATWGVPAHQTLEELFGATRPLFVVVCVSNAAAPDVLKEAAAFGVPLLAETPPGPTLEKLVEVNASLEGRKVQVAEQYLFQPYHAAILGLIASGRLGRVSQAQVSVAHGYHGMSLIRHFLGVEFEDAAIRARTFRGPLVAGPGRAGPPLEERMVEATQTIAHLDFGDRSAVFDFTGQQYFSWIRSPRILVRGERGEVNNREIRYLLDYATPAKCEFVRQDAGAYGNLEGYYHKGFLVGDQWVYRNPCVPGRLTDDEIAVATCLEKMAAYARGGPPLYSLAEASQDTYLALMMEEAIKKGGEVRTSRQPWVTDRA